MSICRLAAPALLLALAACGSLERPPVAATPDAVAQGPAEGGKFIAFVGPRRQHAEAFLGVPGTNFYLLRSWLDTRSGERLSQLYVEDSYVGAERHYDSARDGDGQALKFVPISANEIACENGACSYAEEFGATLPDALLRAHAQGLAVTFAAKSGPELTIAVPGDLIQKQLAAVDAGRAALPATTAAAPPSAEPPPVAAPLR